MASPEYTPVARVLPDVYQDDAASFEQISSFLGLADELQRTYIDALDELTSWLSPLGPGMWPPGLLPDAGPDAVLEAQLASLEEVAGWVGFSFPPSWPRDGAGVAKRRAFLVKAARLWRRRTTPRGFLDWFCLAFDIEEAVRPFLVEHFKIGAPVDADGNEGPDPGSRATLFVASTDQFLDFSRRREAIEFVERNAPAHVLMRVCWVDEDFTLGAVPGSGASAAAVTAFRDHVKRLLCSLVSLVEHQQGLRIWTCIGEGRDIDRLGTGRLPGGGEIPDD